ncbi:hypothetical protein F3Y22_tig00110777pilonHSYRG00026 [Hibiscus syriacus]|uniref:Glycosyl hydrolase family 32 N-terminal domain-containing protein n=1 Tax=Hibiscus syriacus TaxID=106335 RepID=A0A6A2ZRA8_HIBSY|nr:hypothetical protein F3Y22_tig00110777pilonHSYRG00026 [Hibiscus syriacus]
MADTKPLLPASVSEVTYQTESLVNRLKSFKVYLTNLFRIVSDRLVCGIVDRKLLVRFHVARLKEYPRKQARFGPPSLATSCRIHGTIPCWNGKEKFYFQPEKNWMNDPNGPLFYNGWYHFFYQYNPNAVVWGDIVWGHAVSKDLINWFHLPLGTSEYTTDSVQVQNLPYPANLSVPLLIKWDFINYEMLDGVLHAVPGTGMWECEDFFPVSETGEKGLDTSVNGPGVKHVVKAFYVQHKSRRVLWGWIGEAESEAVDMEKGWTSLQAIPRTILLDSKTGTNLLQRPVEETDSLRLNNTEFKKVSVQAGSVVPLDVGPTTQKENGVHESLSCKTNGGAAERGALGPFGLLVLADDSLSEQTPVNFYMAKSSNGELNTFFCSDLSRYENRSCSYITSLGRSLAMHILLSESSKAPDVDKQIFGNFVPVLKDENLSLRILVEFNF